MAEEEVKKEAEKQEDPKEVQELQQSTEPTLETPEKEEKIEEVKKKEEKTETKREGRGEKQEVEWVPKTSIGKKVKEGKITDIDTILNNGLVILEEQIVDTLIPNIETDLILIGQSKGKFGGGQRRVFRQTQKKTMEGNKPQFTTMAIVGDKNGHIGLGLGKAKETVPARDKAIRQAKLNIFKIRRGSGSWEGGEGYNSIPFAVKGKCGSVIINLMPAPTGKGLVAEKEVAKVLTMAGINDIWSKSFGQTKNKINLIKALEAALRKLTLVKLNATTSQKIKVYEGSIDENATA